MENFKDEALPENVRCIANHKLKARILKNNMIRDRMDHKEDNLGAKIIKYETFLSQNMLQNIKTQELAQFQQEVRQFCTNKKSMQPLKSQSFQRSLNMQSLFDQVRKQVKIKEKSKRRSKTYENSQTNFMLLAKPSQLINRENINSEHINTSEFVREQLGERSQFRRKQKQINLKGKIMNSSLVGIMEKMEDMKYYSKKTGRKLGGLIELQSPFQLKEQKQRLKTSIEENQRVKFVPIGKISENSKIYQSQDKLFVSHMPKLVNKNVSEKRQMNKIANGQTKIGQSRKSTLKLEDPLGLKFRSKRKSAQFKVNQDEKDEDNDIKCF